MESVRTFPETSTEGWMRAVVESLREVIWVHDLDGTITYCSPSAGAILGYSPTTLQETNEHDFIHPLDLALRTAVIDQLVATNEPQPAVDMRLRNRDGTFGWFELADIDLLEHPTVHSIVTTARDIGVRKAAAEELIAVSMRDSLTRLPNRLALMDRLDLALARTARSGRVLAVLFCDLDAFKVINDTLGHEAGDQVLREVADRLHRQRRGSDTVARAGGDEFVVVCEGLAGAGDAIAIAAQIRDAVEQPLELLEVSTSVSVSTGIVTLEGRAAEDMDATVLLRNADAAMYCAKRQGRARWQVFDDTLYKATAHRSRLESELQLALDRREFVLHYQPIFNLEHHVVVGSEALLRWNHPSRGLLLPSQFLESAEHCGVIVSLGAWALAEACAQHQRWKHELGYPDWISLNVSARQVVEPGFADTLSDVLAATDLRPDCLWLVLSEHALMAAGHSASMELTAVEDLGVNMGLDDFGAGNASPANLQQLPIDFLRIGPRFVANVDETLPLDAGGNAIVSVLAKVGHGLQLRTIADGIDRDESLELVREFACDYGQGTFLGPAMTSEEFTRLLVASLDPADTPGGGPTPNVPMLFGLPRLQREEASS